MARLLAIALIGFALLEGGCALIGETPFIPKHLRYLTDDAHECSENGVRGTCMIMSELEGSYSWYIFFFVPPNMEKGDKYLQSITKFDPITKTSKTLWIYGSTTPWPWKGNEKAAR